MSMEELAQLLQELLNTYESSSISKQSSSDTTSGAIVSTPHSSAKLFPETAHILDNRSHRHVHFQSQTKTHRASAQTSISERVGAT